MKVKIKNLATFTVVLSLAVHCSVSGATGGAASGATGHQNTVSIAPTLKQESFVTGISYSPDGTALAVTYRNRPPTRLQNGTGRVLNVYGFSPEEDSDKRSMILSGQSKAYRRAFSRNSLLRRPTDLTAAVFSSDGKLIAASGPGVVRIFDTANGQQVSSFSILENSAMFHVENPAKFEGTLSDIGGTALLGGNWSAGSMSLSFSPDQKQLAVCQPFGCSVRDAKSGDQIYCFQHPGLMGGRYIARYSPDGRYLAVLSSGAASDSKSCSLDVLDAQSGKSVFSYPGSAKNPALPVSDLAFAPSGNRLGFFTSDGHLLILSTTDWRKLYSLPGTGRLAFAPDGKSVALTSEHSVATLVDIDSGRIVKSYLQEHPGAVTGITNRSLCIAPDGSTVAIAGEDYEVLFWNVK